MQEPVLLCLAEDIVLLCVKLLKVLHVHLSEKHFLACLADVFALDAPFAHLLALEFCFPRVAEHAGQLESNLVVSLKELEDTVLVERELLRGLYDFVAVVAEVIFEGVEALEATETGKGGLALLSVGLELSLLVLGNLSSS